MTSQNPFKHILVGLDLSEMDNQLIKYTLYLTKHFEVEKIYFVHNIKKYELSDLIAEEIDDIDLEKAITDELTSQVANVISSDVVDWEILISDDPYTESLINYITKKYHINTVILGNKTERKGTGLVGFKLLRILKCNVLWVPQMRTIKINKLWVATDFSNASQKAFSISQLIQEKLDCETSAVHVYNLPMHFSPYINNSKIEDKLDKKITAHINKRFDNFIKKLNYSNTLNKLIFPGREANPSLKLSKEVKYNKVSMLIVTDKGENIFSNLMVGSVTEELFNRDLGLPLFVNKVVR